MQSETILPVLKWAGGKRWLVNRFPDLIPKDFNKYYEPFVGSGAIFFALRPKAGQISDSNPELINVYKAIKKEPDTVFKLLHRHSRNHCTDHYYKVRATVPTNDAAKAARTLYLNRTCWNGLYRVNKRGEFNVPRGTKTNIIFPNEDFEIIAKALGRIAIKCCDFEEAISSARTNDFLFVDPPYTVRHNNNGFIKYNESIFTWADQLRLRNAIHLAWKRGVKVLITNANHRPLRDMYREMGVLHTLPRASIISGSAHGRRKTSELAVQVNYEIDYNA